MPGAEKASQGYILVPEGSFQFKEGISNLNTQSRSFRRSGSMPFQFEFYFTGSSGHWK